MKKIPKIIPYCKMEKGIKLRSGKILRARISYYYDSDDDYLCDGKMKPLLTNVPPPPTSSYKDLGTMIDEIDEREFQEFVTESIKEEVTSEIGVPNGFGEVAGDYLEKLIRSHKDRRINFNQLHELVKGFEKHLSWFPDNVPQEKIKKFCREAYAHVLWKTFLDEEISRRQFVSLMGRTPKFFPKK